MIMIVEAAPITQIVPANRQASGAFRSPMKNAITRPTLTAAITRTAMVEMFADTIARENPQVDAVVLNISIAHTTSVDLTVPVIETHLTRYSSGNRQIQSRSTMCQNVAPLS